jgi:hypothetical protein
MVKPSHFFRPAPLLAAAGFLALLGLVPLASADDTTQPAQNSAATAARTPVNRDMYRALHEIETAELALIHVPDDQGGHQPKALDLLKQAEAEVRAALPPPRGRRAAADGTTGN